MRSLSRRVLMLCLAGLMPIASPSTARADANDLASDGNHMIFQRILTDDFDGVRAYLDAGREPEIRGFMDQTVSISAAASNSWRMVELFIVYGADLSLESRNGRTVASIVQPRLELGNVRLSSPDGQAFLRVQAILRKRGLL